MNEKGFAVFAYLILVGIIFAIVVTAFMVYIYDIAGIETAHIEQKQDNLIVNMLSNYYLKNAYAIDQESDSCLKTKNGCITNGVEGYRQLAKTIGLPKKDAWGNTYILCITKRLTSIYGIPYHHVYVISPGKDHRIGTECNVNSAPVKDGKDGDDDIIISVNGKKIESSIYKLSMETVNNLASVIKGYVKGLYVGNNRYADKDYFVSKKCASNGGGEFGCYKGTPINQTNLKDILSLKDSEMKDAWGNYIIFDNYSNKISHTHPPFSARVGITLPDGSKKWVVFGYTL